MKKRKAFNLRWSLVVYNFGVTALNGWMAIEVCRNIQFEGQDCLMIVHSLAVAYLWPQT